MPRPTPAPPPGRGRSSSPTTNPAAGESSDVPESNKPTTTDLDMLFGLWNKLPLIVVSVLTLAKIGRIHRRPERASRRRIDDHDEEADDDGHRLFEILEDAGIEVDDELATTIEEEVARIKAPRPRVREAAAKVGGGKKEKSSWKHLIDDVNHVMDNAADGIGLVLLHSAGFCVGGLALLSLMFI